MNMRDEVLRSLGGLFIAIIAASIFTPDIFAVIAAREGSGAVFPLSRQEMIRRDIGQPVAPPSRFMVADAAGGVKVHAQGTYPVPVLLGQFPNLAGSYPRDDYQALLFDGPWPTGTMTDYYHEISYDQFTVTGTVSGWYEVPNSNGYYQGGNNGFGSYPTNAAGFVYDLVSLADPDVDFSQYDNDGPDGIPNSGDDDGYVDALFAVHAGEGGECGGPWLWSHRSSLSGMGAPIFTTDDPKYGGGNIKVNDYILMPGNSCGGAAMIEIGVFCHEFGHSLGLPDLYDTDNSSEGIGGWGLMGSGSWGGDQRHPETPSHMCPWSKEELGWVNPIEVPSNLENAGLPRVEDSPIVLKIWQNGDESGPEYFLVENRQQVGFDSSLLRSGILIWHIDNNQPGNWNENHYMVDLEEADGEFDLDRGSNRGDGGDPYPGSSGNRFFNWSTLPNSQDYNGDTTQVAVDSISDPDSVVVVGDLIVHSAIMGFLGYSIDDSGGDNDNVVDIGETVDIAFSIHNYSDTPAESVWAHVFSSDPALTFPVDSVFIGMISPRSDYDGTGQPFTMQVDAGTDIHNSEFTIELSGSDRFYYSHSVEFLIGHPTLLLVQDDDEDDYSLYYRQALDSLGVPYYMRDVYQNGSPVDSLEPFDTVIWFTGRAASNTLTPVEQDSLKDFLNRGGDLFLSGQNIAEDLNSNGGTQFLEQTLGVSYSGNTFDPILNGVESNQVGEGLETIVTAGSGGANDQTSRDVLVPLSGSMAAIVYDTTSGEVAGVTRYLPQTDTRIVFFGFGFEAINRSNPSDSSQVSRYDVMANVMDFLTGQVGIAGDDGSSSPRVPRSFSLSQNYPNPFNPMTTIAFSIPERQVVRLDVFDLRGREIRSLVRGNLMPGYYSVQWNGKDDRGAGVASGVYLYRLRSGKKVHTRRMLLVK